MIKPKALGKARKADAVKAELRNRGVL